MYYCVKRVKLACLIDNVPLLTAGAGLGEVPGTIEKALYKRPPSLSAQPGQCTCVGRAVCALGITAPHPPRVHHLSPAGDLGFRRHEDGACFLTRQSYRASTLGKKKKPVGEANTTDHAKFTSPLKPGETKEITSIPPRHKEYVFTLQIQASELSSLSQELVSTSVPLKTIPMVPFTHMEGSSL